MYRGRVFWQSHESIDRTKTAFPKVSSDFRFECYISSGSSGRVRGGGEKHEILFSQGRGGPWPHHPPESATVYSCQLFYDITLCALADWRQRRRVQIPLLMYFLGIIGQSSLLSSTLRGLPFVWEILDLP